jgi:hypothetical protein
MREDKIDEHRDNERGIYINTQCSIHGKGDERRKRGAECVKVK